MTAAFDLIKPPIVREEKPEESIYFFIDGIIAEDDITIISMCDSDLNSGLEILEVAKEFNFHNYKISHAQIKGEMENPEIIIPVLKPDISRIALL
ncbi:MAG TPA: hypothetical protein ENJ41_08045 [Oceanospirillales bacterium]|nr:hypothetical protein [Oceanospirillales bacterium]